MSWPWNIKTLLRELHSFDVFSIADRLNHWYYPMVFFALRNPSTGEYKYASLANCHMIHREIFKFMMKFKVFLQMGLFECSILSKWCSHLPNASALSSHSANVIYYWISDFAKIFLKKICFRPCIWQIRGQATFPAYHSCMPSLLCFLPIPFLKPSTSTTEIYTRH